MEWRGKVMRIRLSEHAKNTLKGIAALVVICACILALLSVVGCASSGALAKGEPLSREELVMALNEPVENPDEIVAEDWYGFFEVNRIRLENLIELYEAFNEKLPEILRLADEYLKR